MYTYASSRPGTRRETENGGLALAVSTSNCMAHGRTLVFLLLRREVGAMSEAEFLQELATRTDIAVLELGTRRSRPDVPTHHRGWCHPSAKFVMSDFQDGLDVTSLPTFMRFIASSRRTAST
jgi:hypothetical protein